MSTTPPERRPRGRPATGKDPQHQLRCPEDEWETFSRAAAAEKITVGVWIRQVAMRAAKRVLRDSDE